MLKLLKKLLKIQSPSKQLMGCYDEEYTKKMEANKVRIEIENLEEIANMKVFVNGEEITNVVKIDLQSEYASGRTFRNLVIDRYEGLAREKIKIMV